MPALRSGVVAVRVVVRVRSSGVDDDRDGSAGEWMISFLRRLLPIGEHRPKHWLDTDHRGSWLIPVCMAVCVLAVWGPLFLAVVR